MLKFTNKQILSNLIYGQPSFSSYEGMLDKYKDNRM